jgi:hypothetical protein
MLCHQAWWHQLGLPRLAERARMHHAANHGTCPLRPPGAGNNSTTAGAIATVGSWSFVQPCASTAGSSVVSVAGQMLQRAAVSPAGR